MPGARSVLVSLTLAAVLLTASGGGAALASGPAAAPDPARSPAVSQAGELVTLDELCAFRAPLALTGEAALPEACAPVVDRLVRLRDADPACFERWLAEGAVPDCAPPDR